MAEAALDAASRRGYRANIGKAYLIRILLWFFLWWPLMFLYITEERGFSLTQAGLVGTVWWLSTTAASVPAGAVADRFGRRPALLLGAAVASASTVAFGLVEPYWALLLANTGWGVGEALYFSSEASLVYDSVQAAGEAHHYTQVQGRLQALGQGSWLFAILLGPLIAHVTSLGFPIVLSGFISFAAVVVAVTLKEPPREEKAPRTYLAAMREGVAPVLSSPLVRIGLLFGVLLFALQAVVPTLIQIALIDRGEDVSIFGVTQAPFLLAGVVGSASAHYLVRRVGFRVLAILAPLSTGAVLAAASLWDSIWAFALLPAGSFAAAAALPSVLEYVFSRLRPEQRATVYAVGQLAVGLMVGGTDLLFAWVTEVRSAQVVMAGLAVAVVVSGAVILAFWRVTEARAAVGQPAETVASAEGR